MAKKKLHRYAQLAGLSNVFQSAFHETINDFRLKGKWKDQYFRNDHPLILELGCGKGEYTVGLARMYPENNYIGIDIKGDRLWKGSVTAQEKNLQNAAFIRAPIDKIDMFFAQGEVHEIWLTFPDPQPENRREKKRLTSPRFIAMYEKIMDRHGTVHLKTDDVDFFEYSLKVIRESGHQLKGFTYNLHGSCFTDEALGIITAYEQKYMNTEIPICYLNFSLI